MMITYYPIYPGTVISAKVIGVLLTTDEKGDDEKLIAVPEDTVDPSSKVINDLPDLGQHILIKIKHFFEHYKKTEGFFLLEHDCKAQHSQLRLFYVLAQSLAQLFQCLKLFHAFFNSILFIICKIILKECFFGFDVLII